MSGAAELEGGCACGAVRYRLNAAPMFVHCCHCTSCQTETGSAFVINALIEASEVETTKGAAEPLLTPSESGRGQQIWRCPDCRVALWSNYGGANDAIRFVRVGTLDTPGALPPDIHIYTRSKLPWVRLPDGVPAVEVYYDSAALWPADSLARRNRALGLG
ncbi:GFA family protein [Sphingosinicella sp.]|uniref:GFA family protein n=1 Tax=Sphingosinicella sp. TaxID=1917971 RepID=UPI00403816EB